MIDFTNFINQFPYMDAHELNLDWILKAMKQLAAEMNNFEAANSLKDMGNWDITKQYEKWSIVYDHNYTYVSKQIVPSGIDITNTSYWEQTGFYTIDRNFNLNSINPVANDIITAKLNNIDALIALLNTNLNTESGTRESADTSLSARIDAVSDDLISETNNRTAADAVLSARIDAFEELTPGSTTGDAELQDIRIWFDGTTSTTAGDATRGQASLLNDRIEILKAEVLIDLKNPALWKLGTIQSNGTISSSHDSDNTYLDQIISYPTKYEVNPDMAVYIAKYLNGSFVARTSVSGGSITPDGTTWDSYRIMVIYLNTATGSRTVPEVINDFIFFGNETLYRRIRENEFLATGLYAQTGSKICHYSVDDVTAVIADLINNQNTYTSIYDNDTLAELKNIHDATGLCITLNTFNYITTDPSYSISNVPNKAAYRSDFQAAKSWLKFAFHAENEQSNYNTSTGISAAYDTFVSAIYTLTGSYECIDRFTRLGAYGGTLANLQILKGKTYGIKGLLCADATNRASYYLNPNQNEIVQTKGLYLDVTNEFTFIKTISRGGYSVMENEIQGNLLYQKYVECFSHETDPGWLGTCNTVATWLKNNGYVFAFPSLLFK